MAAPTLIVIAGPPLPPVRLTDAASITLGRSSKCDVKLDHASVSRRHARLERSGEEWFITDDGSRHGVGINGIHIEPSMPVRLQSGDRIQIGPWTLRFRTGDVEPSTLASIDDTTRQGAMRIPRDQLGALAQKRLALLMDSARLIHTATEEAAVAHAVVDALDSGTGFERVALVRPQSGFEALDVIALRDNSANPGRLQPSRSLLEAASEGSIVKMEDRASFREAVSIVTSGVTEAMCAPVIVGDTVDAYVYLDSVRRAEPQPDAAAFCAATADLCGLAFANLRRQALQAEQHRVMKEIEAAHDVQHRLLPPAAGEVSRFRYALRFLPGRRVAGDLFGVKALREDAVAVFIGDVMGKGLAASLIMASVQSYLHALLEDGRPLTQIMSELNRYVYTRSSPNEFATLWLGVLDARQGRLTCVDAGHGYVVVRRASDAVLPSYEGGPPIGADLDTEYQQSVLPVGKGDRLVLMTDGVPEQRSQDNDQFGVERIIQLLTASPDIEHDLSDLFDAIAVHAAREEFDDDVTIASIVMP